MHRQQVLHDLQKHIELLEDGQRPGNQEKALRSGFTALDRLLPRHGFLPGTLIEWLSEGEGTGAMTLALQLASGLLRDCSWLVLLDDAGTFYPPAGSALGVPCERTVVARVHDERQRWWVMEQALRCEGVAVTIAALASAPERVVRRLQLAAEAGGGLGFLLRPLRCRDEPSWADVRLRVKAAPGGDADAWPIEVEVLRSRGGFGIPGVASLILGVADIDKPSTFHAEITCDS